MGKKMKKDLTAKTPCMKPCSQTTATTPIGGCSCSKSVLERPRRRRFSQSAKQGLVSLQQLKDCLRELLPLVPVDREVEVHALVNLLEQLSDQILDDEQRDPDERVRAYLRCIRAFRGSLEHVDDDQHDQEDND